MSKQQATPARGLSAILHGAAPHGNDLERDMQELIAERRSLARDLDNGNGRIPVAELERPAPAKITEPLSPETENLITKGIELSAKQMQKEASDAALAVLQEAQELVDRVNRCNELVHKIARETAVMVAEQHARLRRARAFFDKGMNATAAEAEELPNPLPARIAATPPDAA